MLWLILSPILIASLFFVAKGWPQSWRVADWSATNTIPDPATNRDAILRIYAARAGRWKGIFASHSWIALKPRNAAEFDRFDVVGWGRPVRHNAYAVDAKWYSNHPRLIYEVRGGRAEKIIPQVLDAIERYPYTRRGSYRIWPGPNSNSFVAWVARQVPELDLEMDPTAIGKDFAGGGFRFVPMPSNTGWQVSLHGIIGAGLALKEGVELHILGATVGIGFADPGLKLPAVGRISLSTLRTVWSNGTAKAQGLWERDKPVLSKNR